MALIDFIELRDDDIDIIELSSDEDTVQKDQIAAQHRAALLDRQGMFFPTAEGSQGVQAVFVAAGKGSQDVQAMFVATSEGSQDVQPVFVAASEGKQEAGEPGHALEATSSSMVMEKAPPVAGSEGSEDVQAVSVAAGEGGQEAGESGHALEATAPSMVMEKTTLVAASEGSQDVQAVLVAAGEGGQEAAESGHALEATTLSLVTETPPLDTAKSPYCHPSPTSAPLPSLTSTTPKAQTFEGGDAKSRRVKRKRRKKNYHTDTPRKSPRLIQMGECCASPVEEPAADHKRSRMLGPAEEATASTDSAETVVLALPHAGSTNCLRSPTSATFPSLTSISTKVMTSEGGDAKLVSRRVKHPERNYHILSLVMEKPPLGPTSTSPKALSSEGGDTKLVSGKNWVVFWRTWKWRAAAVTWELRKLVGLLCHLGSKLRYNQTYSRLKIMNGA
uniref:Uncharacterized protein n=1 Tax=Hordeum vulgare subsp. vulgare TaxID=112509 RepID=A0A8I6XTI5_HORVV